MQKGKGLTLIEITLVVVIVVIIASLAIPQYLNFYRSQQLDTAVSEIIQTLRLAQAKALAGENSNNFGVFFGYSQDGSFAYFHLTENLSLSYRRYDNADDCEANTDCFVLPSGLDFGTPILDEENYLTLQQEGFVVFLKQQGTSIDLNGDPVDFAPDNISIIDLKINGTNPPVECGNPNLIRIKITPLGVINKC